MRSFGLAALVIATATTLAQSDDVAKNVYSSSQNSVFLVYVNGSSGAPKALGSAFLVAPRTLITNAHVVEGGNPVLAVDPVRIPLRIVRTDSSNDLALLSVDVDLTSKPLPLAADKVSPGEQVFAIGNPEGLEKTISQGIVSGLRKLDDRNLIQITSPISHGSSGGPILNSKGEVVAVAVGILEDGQNLNFAIPVSYVSAIMNAKSSSVVAPGNVASRLLQANELLATRQKDTYSDDPNSAYQQEGRQLAALMKVIAVESSKDDELVSVACLGTKSADLSDEGIRAARKLVQNRPTPENRALLAYTLLDRSQNEAVNAAFAAKDSVEEKRATAAYNEFLAEAGREALEAEHLAKGQRLLLARFVLGDVKQDHNDFAEAIPLHSLVADANLEVCGTDLSQAAYRAVISESDSAKRPDDAEKWFRRYATRYNPTLYDWDSEGDRRANVFDYRNAADAYEKAAADTSDAYGYDYCYAAGQRYLESPTDQDSVLADGRKCIDASVNQTSKQNESHFNKQLPVVYRIMSSVLDDRGSYQQALEYIRESLNVKPDNPMALSVEATIFEHLQRYSECIAAGQSAIRLSDGKYPWIHFRVGSCYFDSQNWSLAATSFRLAAEADRTDAASAYNLGLSLLNQGYNSDAHQWFREALNRKPDDELRVKILDALK